MTQTTSVLVVAHAWYHDVLGGSFRLASEFALDLASRGIDVTYVCCGQAGAARTTEMFGGIELLRYPPPNESLPRWRRLRHHLFETANAIRRHSHTSTKRVVAVSGHSPLQFLGALKAMRKQAAVKSFVVHSPFDDELAANERARRWSLSGKAGRLAARWVDWSNVRRADIVQTDSQYTLDSLIEKYGEPVRRKGAVVPGWVDCARFSPSVDERRDRARLGGVWDTDLPVFFTLRRLEARMGLDTLIRASEVLVSRGRKFRVLIGGAGALKERLSSEITSAGLDRVVHLLGRLSEEEVPECYRAANCFILPTQALECFGLIVLESFAAATPVIASRVAAIPEIAARQGEEWLFAPGNVNELAAKMEMFLEGQLCSTVDLRTVAEEYNRDLVLQRWHDALLLRR